MPQTTGDSQGCGRAKMALVTGRGNSQKAVLSTIVACLIERPGTERLRFRGAVQFSDPVRRHIRTVLLPIVDNIVRRLGLPERSFEISGVNLGAASALDMGVSISGLSADLPAFVAMLSAALQIPVGSDLVSTGHIASVQGDVAAVQGIPAKLTAAMEDGSIRRFIYPDLREDASLKTLSPNQRARSIAAIMAARDTIRTKAVKRIDELLREAFAEEDIVLASLREGFFHVPQPQQGACDPVSGAIEYLTDDNEKRFWNLLQWRFSAGMCDKGKDLLEAYATFFIRRRRYPITFGARLWQLVCSVPPQVRRLKIEFPILDRAARTEIVRLIREEDCDDLPLLFDAALGRHIIRKGESGALAVQSGETVSDADCILFDTVISKIDEQTLSREIGIPLDSGRGSYSLMSSTVDTYEEFLDTLQAFYIHLQRFMAPSPVATADTAVASEQVIILLEKTFHDRGGAKAAFAVARDGTRGGMRAILDTLTEQFKAERRGAYVWRVFRDALDVSNWDEKVRFMRGAMKRLGPFLPAELRDEPAERFAENWETIVQVCVQSLDRVGQLLRTL